jgi:hypothetical protein
MNFFDISHDSPRLAVDIEHMKRPIPIRISRAGRLGRAEFVVDGHPVTVLTTRPTATASAALAVRQALAPMDFGSGPGRARAADRAASRAAEASGGGALVSIQGDIGMAGEAPPAGWNIRLVGAGAPGPALIHLFSGGLANARARSERAVWSTVSVAADTCRRAHAVAIEALGRGDDAPRWLSMQGVAARLVRTDGSVLAAGAWPMENVAA